MLYAFYDFSLARISYNYFGFLVMAELARRRAGADGVHVVFVPADGDGFRANNQYDLEQKRWRVRNILMAGAGLLPSCRQMTLCQSREEARKIFDRTDGEVFPKGYTIEKPVVAWHTGLSVIAGNRGDNVQVLEASEQARSYLQEWVSNLCPGKKFVTITLRSAAFHPTKNNDVELWAELAARIEKDGYRAVIIPDTDNALLPMDPCMGDFLQVPIAAFNIDLRMALYEAAFLNLFVSNGPAQIAALNRNVQFVQFISGEYIADPVAMERHAGVKFGSTPPHLNLFQKYVWREQTIDVLWENFKEMAALLEKHEAAGTINENLDRNPENEEPWIDLARRFKETNNWDLFQVVFEEMIRTGADDAELYYLKGLVELDKQTATGLGDEKEAVDALTKALDLYERQGANVDQPGQAVLELSHCYQLLGDAARAISILENRIENGDADSDCIIALGNLLKAEGRMEEVFQLFQSMAVRQPDIPELPIQLGLLYLDAGDLDKSAEIFGELIDTGTNFYEPWLELGKIQELNKQPGAAMETYQAALGAGINAPEIIFRLGALHKNAGRLPEAEMCFAWLVERRIGITSAYENLGSIYEALDRQGDAEACYKSALALGLSSPQIIERMNTLQGSAG